MERDETRLLTKGEVTSEKQATKQTIIDRQLVSRRVEKNKDCFKKMEQALGILLSGKTRKSDLLAFARKILAENNLKIERLMKRSKPVLICWFCEHMDLIPVLKDLITNSEMVDQFGPSTIFEKDDKEAPEMTKSPSNSTICVKELNAPAPNLIDINEDDPIPLEFYNTNEEAAIF